MSLDHLWAGWRSAYVGATESESAETPSSVGACVFCTLFAAEEGGEHHQVVHGNERAVVVLNAYPYTSGHVLVLPRRHVSDLADLDEEEASELWRMARTAVGAITTAYRPDGINLGANLGKAAGAGLPDHLHLHALPRWQGDTNFMTTVAGARVLPESLEVTWEKLRAAWPTGA